MRRAGSCRVKEGGGGDRLQEGKVVEAGQVPCSHHVSIGGSGMYGGAYQLPEKVWGLQDGALLLLRGALPLQCGGSRVQDHAKVVKKRGGGVDSNCWGGGWTSSMEVRHGMLGASFLPPTP